MLNLHRTRGLALGCVLALSCVVSGALSAQAVTEFSAGITPGSRPLGITAGPDGNLWFTEQGGDRIGRITPQGVVTEFSAGITPGSQPSEITIGADGNLWFTEQGGGRIGRITPNGLVTEFESAVANGIAGGSDGNVWFTNRGRGFVSRITPAGIVTQFGPNGYLDTGQITAGSDGSLWLTARSVTGAPPFRQWYFSILGIDSNGQYRSIGGGSYPTTPFGGAEPPSGVTQGPDGNVWYMLHYSGGSLSIVRWTLDSPRVRTSYPTNSSGPQGDGGIARGPDGNLWFTNQAALPLRGVQVFRDSIGRITPSGVVTNFAFGSSGKPADITAAPDGNVWFTYVDGSRIGRITPRRESRRTSAPDSILTNSRLPLHRALMAICGSRFPRDRLRVRTLAGSPRQARSRPSRSRPTSYRSMILRSAPTIALGSPIPAQMPSSASRLQEK
jgi:virginiamycin B lyase